VFTLRLPRDAARLTDGDGEDGKAGRPTDSDSGTGSAANWHPDPDAASDPASGREET
jgi:hypothetical protein